MGGGHWAGVVAGTNAEWPGAGAESTSTAGSGSGSEVSGSWQAAEAISKLIVASALCEMWTYTLKKVTNPLWGRNGPFAQDPQDVGDAQKSELGGAEAFWG